jgi:hypothetical protein
MTRQKSFKSQVRARMDKTGESYPTARRQLLAKGGPEAPVPEPMAVETATGDAPAGESVQAQRLSEASVRSRTGRGWDEWFALLDAWRATERRHAEIARWLITEHEVPHWWAHSITVGYEQARGMRAPGQGSNGEFSVGASKTVAVPVGQLFDAFADESVRQRWLPGIELRVRTATAAKSLRADVGDRPGRIVVGFAAKGEAKAQVSLQHEKLPDDEAAARMKAFWRDRFDVLKQMLER